MKTRAKSPGPEPLIWAASLSLLLLLAGCGGGDPTPTVGNSTLGQGAACLRSSQCASGLECEIENGRGVCRAHGAGGAGGAGDDHGAGGAGDDRGGSGGSGDGDNHGSGDHGDAGHGAGGTGGASGGAACQTNADCAVGEECDSEDGTSRCKAHGGS